MMETAWLTIPIVLTAAMVCAAVLKLARCPGWWTVGGVLAGLILGPSILGAAWPGGYERVFIGGVQERRNMDVLQLAVTQPTREPIDPASLADAQVQAAKTWREAQWAHQRPLRTFTLIIVALALLGAGFIRVRSGDRRQGFVAPLSIGAWQALLPGGIVLLMLYFAWDLTVAQAALAGAAVAIGPWVLTLDDRIAADRAEFGGAHMIQTAGRIATIIALAALVWAFWPTGDRMGSPVPATAAIMCIAVGWLLPALDTRVVRAALFHVVLPTLAACATVTINIFDEFSWWLPLLCVVISGDGRWLGAYVGAMLLGGRKSLRTMRLVLGTMASGPTQLAVVAVLAHEQLLPDYVLFSLVLGALTIEVTAPARRRLAQRIEDTEEEIAEILDE